MDDIWNADNSEVDDYYKILGCSEFSTTEQINAEYKVLAKELHPDKQPDNPVAAEKFNKIQKAREVLANTETRADYDKWRRSGLNISYDMWVATRETTHVSLHWALKKLPQQALQDGSEAQTIPGLYEGDFDWQRDTGNEMLRKFRNYQI